MRFSSFSINSVVVIIVPIVISIYFTGINRIDSNNSNNNDNNSKCNKNICIWIHMYYIKLMLTWPGQTKIIPLAFTYGGHRKGTQTFLFSHLSKKKKCFEEHV